MKRKFNNMFRGKAPLMLLLGCLVIAAAVAGTLSLRNGTKEEPEQSQYIDLDTPKDDYVKATQTAEPPTEEESTENVVVNVQPTVEETTTEAVTEEPQTDVAATVEPEIEKPAVPKLHFSSDDKISWPVQGNVVLDYSMDSTIYFPTLDQYKCNPAIVIQGEVGTEVLCPVDAKVITIDHNEEIGDFMVLDLGDNYQAKIGQLKDIPVSIGDEVKAGDVLGCVADPTKYYVVEGSNVYFSMTKDGAPIDPLDYIQ